MCRVQVGLWPYAWREQQDAGYCRESGKGLGGAKRGLGGSMGDPRRDAGFYEANGIVPEECGRNYAVDCAGVRAGG